METFDLVTWLGAAAVALAAVALFALAWRVPLHDALPLDEMLRRQGADPDREERLASGDFAVAIGRCLNCNATQQCRAWLDSGKQAGFEAFCPNAKYVAHTAQRHRSA
jgi:hypothetical protein